MFLLDVLFCTSSVPRPAMHAVLQIMGHVIYMHFVASYVVQLSYSLSRKKTLFTGRLPDFGKMLHWSERCVSGLDDFVLFSWQRHRRCYKISKHTRRRTGSKCVSRFTRHTINSPITLNCKLENQVSHSHVFPCHLQSWIACDRTHGSSIIYQINVRSTRMHTHT